MKNNKNPQTKAEKSHHTVKGDVLDVKGMQPPGADGKHAAVLPDIVSEGLDVLFVGYNPGMDSARLGHHYASRSNRFWKLLYESGLTPVKLRPDEDRRLLTYGYGSTNIVHRPSRSSDEITRQEFADGSKILEALIRKIAPRFVCYVGIGVYRAFAAHMTGMPEGRIRAATGVQNKSLIEGVMDYVCSNPSGLNTIPIGEQVKCFSHLKTLIEKKQGLA